MAKQNVDRDLLRDITNVQIVSVSPDEIKYKLPSGEVESMKPEVMLERALILTDTRGMLERVDTYLDKRDLNKNIKIDPEQVLNITGLKVDGAKDDELSYTLADGTQGSLAPEVAAERALLFTHFPKFMEKVEFKVTDKTVRENLKKFINAVVERNDPELNRCLKEYLNISNPGQMGE